MASTSWECRSQQQKEKETPVAKEEKEEKEKLVAKSRGRREVVPEVARLAVVLEEETIEEVTLARGGVRRGQCVIEEVTLAHRCFQSLFKLFDTTGIIINTLDGKKNATFKKRCLRHHSHIQSCVCTTSEPTHWPHSKADGNCSRW